jgi:hypothetical protein
MVNRDDSPARRLRIFLRDHRVLDASARVPAEHCLATYLGSRDRYVSLTDVDWVGPSEHGRRLALKVDTILWATSGDENLPLGEPVDVVTDLPVELELESGYLLRADLRLGPDQGLTDYLQAAPGFVPVQEARLMPRGKQLGDVVVNQDAIHVVRELEDEEDGAGPPRPSLGTRRRGSLRDVAPAPNR